MIALSYIKPASIHLLGSGNHLLSLHSLSHPGGIYASLSPHDDMLAISQLIPTARSLSLSYPLLHSMEAGFVGWIQSLDTVADSKSESKRTSSRYDICG